MHAIDDDTRRFGRLLHYAGLLVTVACVAAGYSLVHAPAVDELTETAARIEELRLSLRNAPLARQQHQKVSRQLHEVKERIAAIQRRVPREPNAGEFLKEVTQLATTHQVTIKDFHPDKPQVRDGYAELQVTLKGSGSYASVCTFLERLSNLTRLSKVKDLTLSATDSADEYPMTATLIIFFGLQGKNDAVPGTAQRANATPLLGSSGAATNLSQAPASNQGGRRG